MYIDNFAELLDWVKKNQLASVETITIDLTNARTDQLLEVAGLVIYAQDTTDSTNSLQIRHNEISSGLITLTKSYGVAYPFYRLYLTNTAQAGKTITLTIGRASPFNIIDNRSAQDQLTSINNILAELQGDTSPEDGGTAVTLSAEGTILASNANRKGASIHNRAGNGILYVRLGSTVVTTSNYMLALNAGETFSMDDYRGEIRGLLATSGQICQKAEW